MTAKQSSVVTIEGISEEVLSYIAHFLHYDDLISLSQVNKTWLNVAMDKRLWKAVMPAFKAFLEAQGHTISDTDTVRFLLRKCEFFLSSKPTTFTNANPILRDIKELVLIVVQKDGWLLKHISLRLKDDEEVVRSAFQHDGRVLEYASLRLRKKKEVVLAAVQQNCNALVHADSELKDNEELIFAAVQQSWQALAFASARLRYNKKIVREAVQQNVKTLKYLHPSFQKRILAVCKLPTQLTVLSEKDSVQTDENSEFAQKAIQQTVKALSNEDPALRKKIIAACEAILTNQTSLPKKDRAQVDVNCEEEAPDNSLAGAHIGS